MANVWLTVRQLKWPHISWVPISHFEWHHLIHIGYLKITERKWSFTMNKGNLTQIAKFMGPTWDPPGSCQPQMGPMLTPWTLLSGFAICSMPADDLEPTDAKSSMVKVTIMSKSNIYVEVALAEFIQKINLSNSYFKTGHKSLPTWT